MCILNGILNSQTSSSFMERFYDIVFGHLNSGNNVHVVAVLQGQTMATKTVAHAITIRTTATPKYNIFGKEEEQKTQDSQHRVQGKARPR